MVTVNLGINPYWAVAFVLILFVLIRPRLALYVSRSLLVFGWRLGLGLVLMLRAAWPRM